MGAHDHAEGRTIRGPESPLASFCRETPFRPGGPEESSPGREPGVKDQRVRRALKGRHKIQRAQSVVPPLPGSTLGFHPTPGLRPELFSVASSRLQTLPNRVSRQKPASSGRAKRCHEILQAGRQATYPAAGAAARSLATWASTTSSSILANRISRRPSGCPSGRRTPAASSHLRSR
jgi:hypothetical protein